MRMLVLLALIAVVGCETGEGVSPESDQGALPDADRGTMPDAAPATSPDFHCGGYGGDSCPTGFDCLWDNGCCDQFHSCGVSADNTCATSADCLPGYRCEPEARPFCQPAVVCHTQDACPDGEYCKTWQLREFLGGLDDYNLTDGYCAPLAAEAGTFACLGSPTSSWCPEPFTCISGRCHVACTAPGGCPTGLSCQALDGTAAACLASQ